MSSDGYGVSLNYIYSHGEKWRHVINLGYAQEDFDGRATRYMAKPTVLIDGV
jgi:hypothetical protein